MMSDEEHIIRQPDNENTFRNRLHSRAFRYGRIASAISIIVILCVTILNAIIAVFLLRSSYHLSEDIHTIGDGVCAVCVRVHSKNECSAILGHFCD